MTYEDAARNATGLGRAFRGQVIMTDAHDYDRARRVFNASVDRHPALIVRPTDADDVALVVAHAQERGLPLVVRAGGHSLGGTARATARSSWTGQRCAPWRSTPPNEPPGPTLAFSPASTRPRRTRLVS